MVYGRTKQKIWPDGLPRREDVSFGRPLSGRAAPLGTTENLPLAHITQAWLAKEIVKTRKFITKYCDVFRTELLYFFVMRPAYCSKIGDEKTHFLDYFPVAFIVKPEAVQAPFHVYPFDTGGAATGAFKAKANKLIPLEDYALDPSHAAAAGFIGWAFGSLEAYFESRLRPEIDNQIKPNDSVGVGYAAIAKMGVEGNKEHDSRASTVELASSQNVDVPGNVSLMIIPKQMLEGADPFWDAAEELVAAGTDIELYDWQPNRAPNEFHRDLMRISRTWYRRQGMMA